MSFSSSCTIVGVVASTTTHHALRGKNNCRSHTFAIITVLLLSLLLVPVAWFHHSTGSRAVEAWTHQPMNIIRPTPYSRIVAAKRNVFLLSLDRHHQRPKGAVAALPFGENKDDEENNDDNEDRQRLQQTITSVNLVPRAGSNAGGDTYVPFRGKFTMPKEQPTFQWILPPKRVNPAGESYTCCDLLMKDCFIDKSAALYDFLQDYDLSSSITKDFASVTLHLVYPRRFAKTTLLGFIEAVFSPLQKLENHTFEEVKTKIAALERGQDLLKFGTHPVLRLDFHAIADVDDLNDHIAVQLGQAGLGPLVVKEVTALSKRSPTRRLLRGVQKLNDKFKADTGLESDTIVLVDEHDKPFRDRTRTMDDPLIRALINLFKLGKANKSGISLLILCGPTRIVGTGVSSYLNNFVDVSQMTIYHGLCGISAREMVKCCSGELDQHAKALYEGQTLEEVLQSYFVPRWNGFRFGLDKVVGDLDPNTPEGALFSPLDVWEIVQSLVEKRKSPSSKWIATMGSEFECTSFAERYTSSPDGFIQLARNFGGGWMTKQSLRRNMKREYYLTLDSNVDVQRVLFDLGLLCVKEIGGQNEIRLGSPNWEVTHQAMRVLVDEMRHGATPEDLANAYLSADDNGFKEILLAAATAVTDLLRRTKDSVVVAREYPPFQDYLYLELFYRFPIGSNIKEYKLYKEAPVSEVPGTANGLGKALSTVEQERPDTKVSKPKETKDTEASKRGMAVALLYPNGPKKAFLIEVTKHAIIPDNDAESISKAHRKNIEVTTNQLQSYKWVGDEVETVQKVAVSEVWHPKNREGGSDYRLSADYRFL